MAIEGHKCFQKRRQAVLLTATHGRGDSKRGMWLDPNPPGGSTVSFPVSGVSVEPSSFFFHRGQFDVAFADSIKWRERRCDSGARLPDCYNQGLRSWPGND